jgi:hypothetical protein
MTDQIIVGAGPGGGPQVNVFDAETGALLNSFFALPIAFTGGVSVAAANVSGGTDIVVGAGQNGGSTIAVFNESAGTIGTVGTFSAFGTTVLAGMSVGVANVGGQVEIVAGAGPGATSMVELFNTGGTLLNSFFPFDPAYTGGVTVSVADINGQADIVAAGGSEVALFNGSNGQLLTSFMPFAPGYTGSVSVSLADINGAAEIAVGANGQVALFDNNGSLLTTISPFGSAYTGAVSVSLAEVNGAAEVVAGAGPGAVPEVAVFSANGTELNVFTAYNSGFTGGVSAALAPASVACFAAGTRIATDRGPTAVEDLRVGDRVVTAFGETVPVIWVGHRCVDCRDHDKPWTVWPVRVMAHAFADGVPQRDVRLSPDHAVHVDDVLIPVRHLINGTTIVQEKVDRIDYYHVELAVHDVLLADGLPAESYLDDGGRAAFSNVERGNARPAGPQALIWEANACARLTVRGEKVDSARALLQRRAVVSGPALATT